MDLLKQQILNLLQQQVQNLQEYYDYYLNNYDAKRKM